MFYVPSNILAIHIHSYTYITLNLLSTLDYI